MQNRKHLIVSLSLIAAGVFSSALRADDNEDLLKSKNLTAVGNLYLLPAEKDLADGMRKILALKEKVKTENKERDDLENKIKIVKNAIQQWDFQYRNLMDQYTKLTDIEAKNNTVAQSKVLESKMTQASGIKDDLDKKINGISNENREAFITAVLDMGTEVDKAQADYKEFAADDKVKAALENINKTAKIKMRLGPTQEFLSKVAFLKTMRGEVASDTIPIKVEGGVSTVEVTLNGTLTRTMILDTGAGLVSLTADLAEQLKIVPGPTDPTLHLTLADGRVVEAKLMILKSVRVGQFTVKDVECAVLPKNLTAAEPLLGGSFLQKFIVKIDPAARELHLAAVSDPNNKVSTGGAPAPKDPTTRPKKP